MLIFTGLMWQIVVLYHCQSACLVAQHTNSSVVLSDYFVEETTATQEMARLVNQFTESQVNRLKVSTFGLLCSQALESNNCSLTHAVCIGSSTHGDPCLAQCRVRRSHDEVLKGEQMNE